MSKKHFKVALHAVDGCPLTTVSYTAEIIPYFVYRMRDGVPQIFERKNSAGVREDGTVAFIEVIAADITR